MKLDEIKENVSSFFKSIKTEFIKITWPTPPQTKAYTIVVLITLFAVTVFLTLSRVVVEFLFKLLHI